MTDRWKWQVVPTTRRTSKPDMVDIIGEDGRHIASYIRREYAVLMAAAPDLLAGVSGIRCWLCNRWLDEPWPTDREPCPHCCEARAARLKALDEAAQ
jgi:hypothetical protein